MKGLASSHKRRELKKKNAGWIRPATMRTALLLLRLVDVAVRIIDKLF